MVVNASALIAFNGICFSVVTKQNRNAVAKKIASPLGII
jgi:hypothetical protein